MSFFPRFLEYLQNLPDAFFDNGVCLGSIASVLSVWIRLIALKRIVYYRPNDKFSNLDGHWAKS